MNTIARTLLVGPVSGLVIAIVVTTVVTLWEWIENPGGIFRDDEGTRWNFVYDTAISWFLPTLGYGAFIATAILLVVWALRALIRRYSDSYSG